MTEPDHVLAEAAKLFDSLRRRLGGPGEPDPADAWARAVHDEPVHHIATGAPECKYCPVCRAIAASRQSGPGITENLVSAGRSLFAALGHALDGLDRPPTGRPETRPPTGWPSPEPPEERKPRSDGEIIDIG
jgi:hypothetical protein